MQSSQSPNSKVSRTLAEYGSRPRGEPSRFSHVKTYIWSLGQISTSKRSQVDRVDLLLSRDTFLDIAPLLDTANRPGAGCAAWTISCEGGVTAYIQRQRLTEARSRLPNSRNTQSIDSMAQAWAHSAMQELRRSAKHGPKRSAEAR